MKTLLLALVVGALIGVLAKACIFVFWSRTRRVPAQERSPMRTDIRVLIAVSMVAVLTGVGAVLGVLFGIFHLLVIEGGLAGGGHAINSGLDGRTVMYTGMAIGAALGIGVALFFWRHSKSG